MAKQDHVLPYMSDIMDMERILCLDPTLEEHTMNTLSEKAN